MYILRTEQPVFLYAFLPEQFAILTPAGGLDAAMGESLRQSAATRRRRHVFPRPTTGWTQRCLCSIGDLRNGEVLIRECSQTTVLPYLRCEARGTPKDSEVESPRLFSARSAPSSPSSAGVRAGRDKTANLFLGPLGLLLLFLASQAARCKRKDLPLSVL